MKSPNKDYRKLIAASDVVVTSIGIIVLLMVFYVCKTYLVQNNVVQEGKAVPWCGTQSFSGNSREGKEVFVNNCASCHAKDMKTNFTGPALANSLANWQYDTTAYVAFIRNSKRSIKNKNRFALKTWNEYKPTTMPSFSYLSDEDIKALIKYINR
jgi:mono/diheme cytochrome c family protein